MGCPYKAIADDTRRKILELLSQGETAAGDIASKFDISKPAISNHLKILKEAEIVNERKVRQNRLYSLNGEMIEHMKFARNHHREIAKVALVTDSKIADLAESLGTHFIKASIKHFPFAEVESAKSWITQAL